MNSFSFLSFLLFKLDIKMILSSRTILLVARR